MKSNDNKAEFQDEMIGVLTAISIVSKRLATRLSRLDPAGKVKTEIKGDMEYEQN